MNSTFSSSGSAIETDFPAVLQAGSEKKDLGERLHSILDKRNPVGYMLIK